MVFVPGGEYTRGRTFQDPDLEVSYYPNPLRDDLPARQIHVDPFYLDEAEVTNQRYAAFQKATGRRAPYHWIKGRMPSEKASHPVVNVSWDDAVAFCAWERKRLPTEAEWERACRSVAEKRKYPWGDAEPTPEDAHFEAENGPTSVCSKKKTQLGLCDIVGNVWEWTADWYDRGYYSGSPERNPPGPESGIYRVLRGGSWFDQPKYFLACSYRSWARPAERSPTVGFRCAKSFSNRISATQPRP